MQPAPHLSLYVGEAHHTSKPRSKQAVQQRLDSACLGGGDGSSVDVSCFGRSVGRARGGLLLNRHWWADRCASNAGCPEATAVEK